MGKFKGKRPKQTGEVIQGAFGFGGSKTAANANQEYPSNSRP